MVVHSRIEWLEPPVGCVDDAWSAVDRLRWTRAERPLRQLAAAARRRPRPGWRSDPIAVGGSGTLSWGWDGEGDSVWLRVYPGDVRPGSLTTYVDAAEILRRSGVSVAVVRRVDSEMLVLERVAWCSGAPRPADAHGFVTSALKDVLRHGVVVLAGEPHVGTAGQIIIEDIAAVARVEAVDRAMIAELLRVLAQSDIGRLIAILDEITGGLDDDGVWLAKRSALGLSVEWTPSALVLAFRALAAACRPTGGTAARTLWLVADELAHRLSFAYAYPMNRRPLDARLDLVALTRLA